MEKLALGKKGLEVSAIGLGITLLDCAEVCGRVRMRRTFCPRSISRAISSAVRPIYPEKTS
jgi:hypothetical protein